MASSARHSCNAWSSSGAKHCRSLACPCWRSHATTAPPPSPLPSRPCPAPLRRPRLVCSSPHAPPWITRIHLFGSSSRSPNRSAAITIRKSQSSRYPPGVGAIPGGYEWIYARARCRGFKSSRSDSCLVYVFLSFLSHFHIRLAAYLSVSEGQNVVTTTMQRPMRMRPMPRSPCGASDSGT